MLKFLTLGLPLRISTWIKYLSSKVSILFVLKNTSIISLPFVDTFLIQSSTKFALPCGYILSLCVAIQPQISTPYVLK